MRRATKHLILAIVLMITAITIFVGCILIALATGDHEIIPIIGFIVFAFILVFSVASFVDYGYLKEGTKS